MDMSPRDNVRPGCEHVEVNCINPYEFIRKYQCLRCGEVMMCECDREFGERFLPHQLRAARDRHSGLNVPVTLGFQLKICRECRGLPAQACPKAPLHGRTSKVLRYYWREIYFDTTRRFARWAEENGYADDDAARREHPERREAIEREVIEEIKVAHIRSPKYTYSEISGAEILARHRVEIVNLDAEYLDGPDGRRIVTVCGTFESPESAAAAHFESRGFKTLFCESRPFHALFGVYMWLLIQDPNDPLGHVVGFGDRFVYEAGRPNEMIWTRLPEDFGTPGYGVRQAETIAEHLATLDRDLLWLFDYWRAPSSFVRQYLWAHRDDTVATARRLVEILPGDLLRRILKYLVESYWARYTGWPDLLVYDADSYFFTEVKSSRDKLREDQKRWIEANATELKLPFKLVRLHRAPAPAKA